MTDSTSKAEYVVASKAAKEVACINKFLIGLDVVQGASNHSDVYYDNDSATVHQGTEATQQDQAYPDTISPHS